MTTTTRPPRWLVLTAALLIGVLTLACGGAASSRQGGSNSGGSSASGSQPAAEATAAPATFAVGQDVTVDEVRWKILSAEDLGQTLKSSNEFIKEKTTSGHFVRVRFELENMSKDMLSYAGLDLIDGQGRSFKPSSDTFSFIEQEEQCVLENLNPNVPKTCTAIYEVPTNAGGLQAQVTDLKLLGGQQALVDLGLAGK